MPGNTTNKRSTGTFLLALGALLVSFLHTKLKIYDGILVDPFHQGEYFAALSSILHSVDFNTLTIHGALDYIPGLITTYLFGSGQYFHATQLMYLALDLSTSIILLHILDRYTQTRAQLIVAAFILPYFTGYRDFSLFLLLATFLYVYRQKPGHRHFAAQILLGLATCFNFYWSTNRGVSGTIVFGIICLMLAIKQKEYIIAITSFIISTTLVSFLHPVVDLRHYIDNILFLMATSYQWGYAPDLSSISLKLFFIFLVAQVNILILRHAVSSKTGLHHAILFLLLSVFFIKISTYRSDIAHIYMGLPVYILTLTYWHGITANSRHLWLKNEKTILTASTAIILGISIIYKNLPIGFLALYSLMISMQRHEYNAPVKWLKTEFLRKYGTTLLFGLFALSITSKAHKGAYDWMIANPFFPTNAAIATAGNNWAAQEIKKSGSSCVFDLTNNGVINGLTNLPACTRFSYIVYADRNYEPEIIKILDARRPPAIVYSANFWSYQIDDKPMSNRFPDLDKYILQHYPHIKCESGYCVRYTDLRGI